MAGIAFNIRKLLGKHEISSTLAAFIYSGIISSGPWLFAVFALGVIASVGKTMVTPSLVNIFMGLVIYTFALTTVLTYGPQMAITRYLADCLYRKEDKRIPSLLITSLLILGGSCLILTAPFIWTLEIQFNQKILALYLMVLVSSMWGAMIFVSTLKAYIQVSVAFVFGFGLAVPFSLYMGKLFGLTGFLLGLNVGISFVVFMLCALILSEFEGPVFFDPDLVSSFKRYPLLFFYGVMAGFGIWVDKFIFWFHHQVPIGAGLIGYPLYDGAMFIGYMTALPSLAYFILIAETDLYDIVRKYTHLVNNHGSLRALTQMQGTLHECLKNVLMRMGTFQGIFTLFLIFTVPMWISLLGLNALQISILRIAMLGAFFHMGMMLITIVLTYINGEKDCFILVFTFLLINLVGTWLTLNHFWLYGYGYFAASFISFFLGIILINHRLKHLHYYLICSPNN